MVEPVGLTVALGLAELGIRVIPAWINKEGDKVPLAGNWVENATTQPAQLRRRWEDILRGRSGSTRWLWPGVVSGPGSCLVFDADGPAAVDSLRTMVKDVDWNLEGCFVYRTPGRGGGLHIVCSWGNVPDLFGQSKVDGVQLRGRGHWAMFCGAQRKDGDYEMIKGDVTQLLPPPAAITSLFMTSEPSVYMGGGGNGEIKMLSLDEAKELGVLMDDRKNTAASLVWGLAAGEKIEDEEEVARQVKEWNQEYCDPPLPDKTIEAKAAYGVRRAKDARELWDSEQLEEGMRVMRIMGWKREEDEG